MKTRDAESKSSGSNFSLLPAEIMTHLFGFFPEKELLKQRAVSKGFKIIADDLLKNNLIASTNHFIVILKRNGELFFCHDKYAQHVKEFMRKNIYEMSQQTSPVTQMLATDKTIFFSFMDGTVWDLKLTVNSKNALVKIRNLTEIKKIYFDGYEKILFLQEKGQVFSLNENLNVINKINFYKNVELIGFVKQKDYCLFLAENNIYQYYFNSKNSIRLELVGSSTCNIKIKKFGMDEVNKLLLLTDDNQFFRGDELLPQPVFVFDQPFSDKILNFATTKEGIILVNEKNKVVFLTYATNIMRPDFHSEKPILKIHANAMYNLYELETCIILTGEDIFSLRDKNEVIFRGYNSLTLEKMIKIFTDVEREENKTLARKI